MSKPEPFNNTTRVIAIILGSGNKRQEECRRDSVISYGVNKISYELYIAKGRQAALDHYLTLISSGTKKPMKLAQASRRVSVLEDFINTGPEVIWLNKCGDTIYWAIAEKDHFIEKEYIESNPNPLQLRGHYLLQKNLVYGWMNVSLNNQPMRLDNMHPNMKKWMSLQSAMADRRGEGKSYILDFINGAMPLVNHDAYESHKNQKSISNLRQASIDRMIDSAIQTAKYSNGQKRIVTIKNKDNHHDRQEWRLLLDEMMELQGDRCKLTGQALELDGENRFLMPSLDRIDSNGDYERGNVQVVSWAANRAKGALASSKCSAFFSALQFFRKE